MLVLILNPPLHMALQTGHESKISRKLNKDRSSTRKNDAYTCHFGLAVVESKPQLAQRKMAAK
ncbi:hypothetical protein GmHk_08G021046 [Glycine max]|nr:hypothetical protein GmHk_08G021046 [Glycine max]